MIPANPVGIVTIPLCSFNGSLFLSFSRGHLTNKACYLESIKGYFFCIRYLSTMDLKKESETMKGRTANFFSPDQSRPLDRDQFAINVIEIRIILLFVHFQTTR